MNVLTNAINLASGDTLAIDGSGGGEFRGGLFLQGNEILTLSVMRTTKLRLANSLFRISTFAV